MRKFVALIAMLVLSGCASMGESVTQPVGADKVVYHLNSGLEQATNGRISLPPGFAFPGSLIAYRLMRILILHGPNLNLFGRSWRWRTKRNSKARPGVPELPAPANLRASIHGSSKGSK